MRYQAPRGTRDILPQEMPAWHYVEKIFAETCAHFNFHEIRVPTFEQTELFQRSVGDTTDIVQKEMYTFDDKGGRSMTLRPEGTAGVVRAYLENGMASEPSPLKLFYDLTIFRYEKMGKGRYREFNQMGCEVFGSVGPASDVELISLLFLFFERLGVKRPQLKLNSIGCPVCRPGYVQQLKDYFRPRLDELCPTCRERFERNPLRILDCKEEACAVIAADAPVQLDALCDACDTHFRKLREQLDALGYVYEVDTHIVRGLDYYTKTVFEFVSANVGTQGSICGGGRYDGLVAEMGGPDTPGVGFALGTERLLMELASQSIALPELHGPDVFIISFPDTADAAARLCLDLRTRGVAAEFDLMNRSFRAQMKFADRIGSSRIIVLGEDELSKREVKIRRLSDGAETSATFADLADVLKCNQEQ